MEKIVKHNQWVLFYILAVVALISFAFFAISNRNMLDTRLPFSSPEFTEQKIKALCGLEKYREISLISVQGKDGEMFRIIRSDLDVGGGGVDYISASQSLCKTLGYARKVIRNNVSDTQWKYDYRFGLFHDSGKVYKIIYFDEDWRFVLVVDEN